MLDIHSHILPGVDDGAQTIDESISILESMYSQGITTVIATPHFYPHEDNLEDFNQKVKEAFIELNNNISNKKVPEIYLGCEIFYYNGISKASSLYNFTVNGSKYLLLELNKFYIKESVFKEILSLKNEHGIIPIIAHIERYQKSRKYKAFIEFIKQNNILTQVNATSFFSKEYSKILKKLFAANAVTFIATDSHSIQRRPPLLKLALDKISAEYGEETKEKLIENSKKLFNEITNKEENDDI